MGVIISVGADYVRPRGVDSPRTGSKSGASASQLWDMPGMPRGGAAGTSLHSGVLLPVVALLTAAAPRCWCQRCLLDCVAVGEGGTVEEALRKLEYTCGYCGLAGVEVGGGPTQ